MIVALPRTRRSYRFGFPMKVTYENTRTDLRALERHARGVHPLYRRAFWMRTVIAVAFGLMEAVREAGPLGRKVLAFAVTAAAMWAFMWIFGRLATSLLSTIGKKQKGYEGVFCEHTVAIDPQGITETTQLGESRVAWRGIYRVDSTAEHLFIYTQPGMAHIIPRRAFASSEEADNFLRTVAGYHSAAATGGSSTSGS